MERTFQVDLHGLVDLLSHHLYSSPRVFVRELLQNAVDAITARQMTEPLHRGAIDIELVPAKGQQPATLVIADNGIGLSLADAETFLATIGRSSKRDDLGAIRREYLGQFGIGLLACFVVSDEIVVLSRSSRGDAPVEWRGRPDGTYSVRELDDDVAIGTRVYLRARPDAAEWFTPDAVRELVEEFGEFLPPVATFRIGTSEEALTGRAFPWERAYPALEARDRELLAYGVDRLNLPVMDVVDLQSDAGEVVGVGYFVGSTMSPVSTPAHRVYVKRMLLSDHVDNLLPPWAFFIRAMVNADALPPTASREQLFDDEVLLAARDELGAAIRRALIKMAEDDPDRLRRIVDVHYLGLKALAVHDDEFLRLFADWLPVETSMGRATLGQLRRDGAAILLSRSNNDFQQLVQVAAARGDAVVNGGLVYDAELVQRLPNVFPDVTADVVDATNYIATFEGLSIDEQVATAEFLKVAGVVLAPFGCEAEVRRFEPASLPGLLSTPDAVLYQRDIERTKPTASPLWAAILEDLSSAAPKDRSQLCFNMANPLVQKIVAIPERGAMAAAVGILYVQTMLLGRHAVSDRELSLMGSSVSQLLEWTVGASGVR